MTPGSILLAVTAADILSHIPGLVGGGGLVLIVEAIRKAYTTRVKEREHTAVLEDRRDTREADDSRSFVTEANAERRATLLKVDTQAAEITRLAVEVARCTAKHEAHELRDAEKDRQIHQLTVSLDMTQQLVKRQRDEVNAQELVIESQGRDIISLHAQYGELKASFDEFVKRAMGVEHIGQVPGHARS